MNSVPFSAWDADANPPVRLAVGHTEVAMGNGLVDGKYWSPRDQDQGVDNAATGE
ncbi:MAG TPA: hypothetical protein VF514_10520 [Bacteroidota bacterium]